MNYNCHIKESPSYADKLHIISKTLWLTISQIFCCSHPHSGQKFGQLNQVYKNNDDNLAQAIYLFHTDTQECKRQYIGKTRIQVRKKKTRVVGGQGSCATINLIDRRDNYSMVSFIASLYSGGGRVMLAEEGPLIFSIHKPNSFGSAAWNRYSAPFAKLERYLLQLNSVLTLWK